MEQRKIVIIDSSSNRKVTVTTDATSFGELKRAARAAGINYEGKDWLEGLTKTSPVSDDSLLPVNVNYKGTITNNLVYMLTNTNKRIKNGMSRAEIYAEIKKLGLAEEVKATFGRNFTQVGTKELIAFIEENSRKVSKGTPKKKEDPKTPSCCNYEAMYNLLVEAIAKFLVSIPQEILDTVAEVSKNIVPETSVEEIDFSEMSVDELKKQFGR